MAKYLRVSCVAGFFEPVTELREFQRRFKVLREEDRVKLRAQLLKLGIFEPFIIWKDDKGQKNVVDGHQRLQVIREMLKAGDADLATLGDVKNAVPVIYVQAKDAEEAVRMVLAGASTYGRVDLANLAKFRGVYGITEAEFQTSFSFPELEVSAPEGDDSGEKVEFTAKKKLFKCPKCGEVFEGKKHKHDPKVSARHGEAETKPKGEGKKVLLPSAGPKKGRKRAA